MRHSDHQCPECNCYYKTDLRMKNHLARTHKKPQKLGGENTCCFCGDEFGSPMSLSSHLSKEHNEDYSKLNNGKCYIKRYRKVKREIPEKYHDAFEEMTGSGRSLLSVQAAVCYIESSVTQDMAADIFAVSDVTVRQVTRDLVDRGIVSLDYIQENCIRDGNGQFGRRTDGEVGWKPEA